MSETAAEFRLDRLEADMRDVKATLGRLEPLIIRIDATLPHLTTKAEVTDLRSDMTTAVAGVTTALADKPGKVFLVGAIAVLLAAYALGLAGLAALPTLRALTAPTQVSAPAKT